MFIFTSKYCYNMKIYKLIFGLFFCFTVDSFAQSIIWQNDFETPSEWTLNMPIGQNGIDANSWFISDTEGGVPAGNCGVASNGNKTLHIGCQGNWCFGTGAAYNAGDGGLGFIDATTNKRALFASNISTLNAQNLSLEFDYVGIGEIADDYGTVVFSIDGGTTWVNLQTITPATTCPTGQGLWTHVSIALPPVSENISNLRLGFDWRNSNNGVGSDPSLAINNLRISTSVLPTPQAVFGLNTNQLCQNDCINIENSSLNALTYSWDFGNGISSNLQNPSPICYSSPGQYTISLIACNSQECDTTTQFVTVFQHSFSTETETACNSYLWNGQVYNQSGTYTFLTSNINGCDSISTLVLTINPNPNVIATDNGDGTITASAGSAYQWIDCATNMDISGATNQTFAPNLDGQYSVIVTLANGCSDSSDCILINNLGIEEGQNELLVFPNPSNGLFQVSLNKNDIFNVEVFDPTGRIIKVNKSDDFFVIDDQAKGIYFIQITYSDGKCIIFTHQKV